MPYRLTLNDVAAAGTCYRVDGRHKLDAYLFQRSKALHNHHVLVVPDHMWTKVRDDIFFEGQKAVIKVDYEIDPESADAAVVGPLQATIDRQNTDLAANAEKITSLEAELDKTRLALTTAQSTAGGLTDEQLEFLRERDAMIDMLATIVLEGESPTDVLARIVEAYAPTPTRDDLENVDHRQPGGDETRAAAQDDDKSKNAKPEAPAGSQAAPEAKAVTTEPPPAPAPKKAARHTPRSLGMKPPAKLQTIAGELGISGAHEFTPIQLIPKILEAQAKAEAAAVEAAPAA